MQTAVSTVFPIGIPGQLADEHTAQFGDVVTRTNQEASAEIAFGLMVKRGTTDQTCKLIAANSDIPDGIVVFSQVFDYPTERGDTGLKPGATFGVLRRGRIYVVCEEDVTPASEVHVRATVNGGATILGGFRATADGAHTIDITGFAKWVITGVAGDPVVLEVDMTDSANAVADS